MEWIDRKITEIPYDQDVIVIWKGRIGIFHWDKEKDKKNCAICPHEFYGIMEMDEECFERIAYWQPLPKVKFRCDEE